MHGQSANAESGLGWRLTVGWAIASLAGLAAAMAAMTIDRAPTDEAGAANLRNLWPYWLASACGWAALSCMWFMLRQRERGEHKPQSPGAFFRVGCFVIAIAVAARIAVLATHNPALSDDVYRYVYEGRNLAAGLNPYLVRAIDRRGAARENWPGESLLIDTPEHISSTRLVTYGELISPYLPASHYVFAAMGLVIGDRWTHPLDSARVFRWDMCCWSWRFSRCCWRHAGTLTSRPGGSRCTPGIRLRCLRWLGLDIRM